MKQQSEHALAATQIRAEMKRIGLKGSVRSESYSGGTSIRVSVDCSSPDMLSSYGELETFANEREYGHFDGMTDCYEYSNSRTDIPQVKFVFVSLNYSDDIRQDCWDHCKGYWYGMDGAPERYQDAWQFFRQGSYDHGGTLIHRALSDRDSPFWQSFYQKEAA